MEKTTEITTEEGCTTPRSGRFRIPVTSVCPPPPRKKSTVRLAAVSCGQMLFVCLPQVHAAVSYGQTLRPASQIFNRSKIMRLRLKDRG
ncbi:hypothetical protein AALP_AA8G013900 [Arabis alpina]|uniref:Uncharacterized protein n=1 Tax=Arabis alpina TaxID=50452 RepID=A0A087G4A4_ARAAL|nr:hypothetical protein AALP_AA8G013900 [Arabis alpina]